MPTILEEGEPNFADLLDLPDTMSYGVDDALIGTGGPDPLQQPLFPSQAEFADFLCPEFMGDWDLPDPSADTFIGLEEPDYAKFENWIPQFLRPEKPCDYCRVKRLECYITRGQTVCTPCSSLFRDCSLTNTHTLEAANQATGYLLDTLHVVDEDTVREQGSLTGIKNLRSRNPSSGTSTPVRLDDAPGSSKRNGIRFPRHAVKVLRDWLDAHASNPYPTDEQKVELEKQTDLAPSQVANWLANARRRRKMTEKARARPCVSPSLKPSTPAIDIPQPDKPWDELNPFERWQHSPPENEPASMTDIAYAVATSELADDACSTSPSTTGRRKNRSSNGSGFSNIKAPSTASLETVQSSTVQSSSLSASNSAAFSNHSSQSRGSFASFSSSLAGKRDRRRRRKPAPLPMRSKLSDDTKRIFQCTFCTDTFKSKYDWTRHEKSLHLSLEKWICAPLGPVITDPATGNKRCVYCDEPDPSADHLDTHNHHQCEEKGLDARTFYRKDHLRQHVRLMHNCEMTKFMDTWKSIAVNINSRCGFCMQRFTVWQERVDHLTAHFKAGARMSEWKGCRGLDPAVAAQVTNAMPPYLIGIETVSPNPFSATNKGTWRAHRTSEQGEDTIPTNPTNGTVEDFANYAFRPEEASELCGYGPKATCWEMLTVRLGKFASEEAQKGITLTDEMLQTQARRILYDSDDSWNQTAADNPEWLDLFKKAHGLDFIPAHIGGLGRQVPEDVETYTDLGLRIPFAVQLQAYNQKTSGDKSSFKSPNRDILPTSTRTLYQVLASEGVLHDAKGKCKHTECDANSLSIMELDGAGTSTYTWCNRTLSPEKVSEIARMREAQASPASGSQSSGGGGDVNVLPKKPFLQRHRYELPPGRAERFETVTGAWADSGIMPAAVRTSPVHPLREPSGDMPSTTTGAMMEFLGGEMGVSLPFSTDATSSTIPLPFLHAADDNAEWFVPPMTTSEAQEAAMLEDIDRLIAESGSEARGELSVPATTTAAGMTGEEGAFLLPPQQEEDFVMPDFEAQQRFVGDVDMAFDGVFDLNLEEGFGF